MPFIPNFIERLLLLNLNKGPGPLLDVVGGAALRSASTALKLGIFENLKNRPLTAAELADRVGASERGIGVILAMLESFGYVKRQDERYSNSAMTSKWLLRESPTGFANYVSMWHDIAFRFWDQYFEKTIRDGKPELSMYEWLNERPECSRLFQAAMMELARWTAGDVVDKVGIPVGARRLLDIGGGHGTYSIRFCQKYPSLHATILDCHPALHIAHENIVKAKMVDRISVRSGNYVLDDLGKGYDAALLFNIVHAQSEESNISLLRKVACALEKGGLVAILDMFNDNSSSPAARSLIRLFDLAFFASFGGQVYSSREIREWLRTTGFSHIRVTGLRNTPGARMIIGQKT